MRGVVITIRPLNEVKLIYSLRAAVIMHVEAKEIETAFRSRAYSEKATTLSKVTKSAESCARKKTWRRVSDAELFQSYAGCFDDVFAT